jgi:hypothetical protein
MTHDERIDRMKAEGEAMLFRGKWKPSWGKGTYDIEVIDRLVRAREELELINGTPNSEQRKKIIFECINILELVK